MEGFFKIAGPLHALLGKAPSKHGQNHSPMVLDAKPFHERWTEECQGAFGALKAHLTAAPVLGYPDFKPFVVETDVSYDRFGAVLSQDQDGVQ